MKVENLKLDGIRYIEGHQTMLADVKQALESRVNLQEYTDDQRPVTLNWSTVMRTCLLVGLSDNAPRDTRLADTLQISRKTEPLPSTFFTKANLRSVFEALFKLRFHDVDADYGSSTFMSKLLMQEVLRGRDILMKEGALDEWLRFVPRHSGRGAASLPELNLFIGHYENGVDAYLDLNSRSVTNTQILVAGTTGSGKSNLLSVLIQQLRSISTDTHYPVSFLLFDYKGEFSDPANEAWLEQFATDRTAILNPMERPLPFTPFKDFTGCPENEMNMYATTLSSALVAITSSSTRISANMDTRLSTAIINAYKKQGMKPITFELVLQNYVALLPPNKQDTADSVTSILTELVRNNIFADTDQTDLIHNCHIINLGRFSKDGILAKAIVYFTISKLNILYERLPKQEQSDERVELRHFTIIDEAHYMLGFENKPLQNLIAVGRNKGMSIILATQNMESFKSRHFDFYANAQYPLIMKQQQQNDAVLKDLFAVSGASLQELKAAIAGLQKGELITKDNDNIALGIGKHWQKINVTHLI